MKKLIALALALTMALALVACGGNAPETTAPAASAIPGVEDGVLTVGMECAYAPYNWTRWMTPTVPCPSPTTPAPTPAATM